MSHTPSAAGRAQTVAATIISPAVTPLSPTTPRTAQNLALGFEVGLLLGAGQAVLRDVLNTRVRTTQDIERVTDRAVIGSIMLDPPRNKGPLFVVADQHSPRAESYKRLRTNLQFLGLEKDHRAIVVTSCARPRVATTW
jgi:succinoglycan biosynthesis transport protein ExoP